LLTLLIESNYIFLLITKYYNNGKTWMQQAIRMEEMRNVHKICRGTQVEVVDSIQHVQHMVQRWGFLKTVTNFRVT